MAAQKKFPITSKQFGTFVAASRGAQFRRGDSDRCPLTRAIQAYRPKAKNGSFTSPGPATLDNYNLPPWAVKFVELYDGNPDYGIKGLSAYAAAVKVGAIK